MTPRPEHRISAIEKRVSHVETGIEELAADTAEEFRVLTAHVDKGFDQAHAFVQERFAEIKADIAELKATQTEQSKRMDTMDSKLDQILALLQQKL